MSEEKYRIVDAPPSAKESARAELLEKLSVEERAAFEAAEKEIGELGRKIAVIVTDDGAIIVQRAHRLVLEAFIDAGKLTFAELLKVARATRVYPGKEAFSKLVDEQPGAITVAANEALALAGVNAKAFSGK